MELSEGTPRLGAQRPVFTLFSAPRAERPPVPQPLWVRTSRHILSALQERPKSCTPLCAPCTRKRACGPPASTPGPQMCWPGSGYTSLTLKNIKKTL